MHSHECHHASKIHDLLTHSQDGFNDFNDIDDVGQPSRRVHLDGESGLETSTEDHNCSRYVKKLKKKKKRRAMNRQNHSATLEKKKNHLKTANMNLELRLTDLLVKRLTSKMMVMVLLKTPLKVMKMTSRSMLSKVNPG